MAIILLAVAGAVALITGAGYALYRLAFHRFAVERWSSKRGARRVGHLPYSPGYELSAFQNLLRVHAYEITHHWPATGQTSREDTRS